MIVFPVMDVGFGEDYSHDTVMSSFKNGSKSDIVSHFGAPTHKSFIEGIEIWNYNLGTQSQTNLSVNTNYNTGHAKSFTDSKFVEFQFIDDKLINYRSNGVDYGRNRDMVRFYLGWLVDLIAMTGILEMTGYFDY